jgi:putative tryptophan/tyrosine transport system substrate-binding protein
MRRRHFIALFGGAAASWPSLAHAQQPERMRHISYLGPLSESDPENQIWVRTLTQSLEELGWKNDINVKIKICFGEADFTRISALADEIVEENPDVIVATGPLSVFALRQFTLSIPIVFIQVADPVSVGFVTNLSRPEGNVTGFTNFLLVES